MSDVGNEHPFLLVEESTVQSWLAEAKEGNKAALDRLSEWAYRTAAHYFKRQVRRERFLTSHDAEDLAAQFALQFDTSWPRVVSVVRYVRRCLTANLRRFIRDKKIRLERERFCPDLEALLEELELWTMERIARHDTWGDEELVQYRVILEELAEADEVVQSILEMRMKDPPLTYGEIAAELGMRPSAVRMRVKRFYDRVRIRYAALRSRRNRGT